MVRSMAFVAVVLGVGFAPAHGETVQRAPSRAAEPAAAPVQVPVLNPLDVPRWMGDAVGHILAGEDPETARPPAGK